MLRVQIDAVKMIKLYRMFTWTSVLQIFSAHIEMFRSHFGNDNKIIHHFAAFLEKTDPYPDPNPIPLPDQDP
jgi:hypothetical protein